MNTSCFIHSFGSYMPERILTNEALSRFVDTDDEWITTRTGIAQRHVLAEGENASDAGHKAALLALKNAGCVPHDITHLLVATCTPEALTPATACILAGKLGCGPIMALDINAACSGFLYGLEIARGLLATTPNATVLLVCVEALTRRLDWRDRSTCVLFGDGAGAAVLRASQTYRADGEADALAQLKDVICASDGTLHKLINIGGGTATRYEPGQTVQDDYFLQMHGSDVFKHAVRSMTAVCQQILERNALTIEDVHVLVPHQANMRIIEAVGERLHIAGERVFVNVATHGNTSSASVPLAIDDALTQGRIQKGDMLLTTSFGAGLTWSAALLQF